MPQPTKYRKRIKDLLVSEEYGVPVTIKGWIKTRRGSKKFSFLEINDGSCLENIQVVADGGLPGYGEIEKLSVGCCVRVEGKLVKSPAKGQTVEVHASEVFVYGWSDPDEYPLQKKATSMEFLRQVAHLRPRTNTFGAVFRIRNALAFAIHKFFQERGFIYVHTPIITASDCEGGAEMFQATTLDLDNPPRKDGKVDFTRDFFGKAAKLTVSGQLGAELFAAAMTDVYTFGPTFRAENSQTPRHLAEFWMIEPEMAFCDARENADLAEEFLKYIFRSVLENCRKDVAFLEKRNEVDLTARLKKLVETGFIRITYTEAMRLLKESGKSFEFPPEWGKDLQTEHERYLTEEKFHGPVVVTDFPKEIKAFYMRVNEDGKTVGAMDVLVPGIGEIIGGSQREERLDVLRGRIKELGLREEDYWWYLDIRRFGTVPHSGFGLGFERTVLFATGMHNIRDVIPFPRVPNNAEF
ncbi:MAG: asparagine--tRNA ligase [Nitrospinae bacterium]|nr:asparagine--tRNA ligase [Nitrospinota bacterium]